MRKILLALLGIVAPFTLYSQTFSGKVINSSTDKPLEMASVRPVANTIYLVNMNCKFRNNYCNLIKILKCPMSFLLQGRLWTPFLKYAK